MKFKPTPSMTYVGVVSVLGAIVLVPLALSLYLDGVSYQWLILAYLTILTGAFTIELAGFKSTFTAADTFIFINTALFGPAAGALTAAIDGFLASLRFETAARKWNNTPFNTAVMGLSAFVAGQVLFMTLGSGPLSKTPAVGLLDLAGPAILAAGAYFLCNSALVATRVAFASGDNLFRIWRQGFLRTSVIFLASGLVGTGLAFVIRSVTPLTLLIVVPILVTFYFLEKVYLMPQAAPVQGSENGPVAQRPAYRRFHYFMVVLGMGFIALLAQDVYREKIGYQWLILAALTIFAGMITVKVPGIKIKFSLGDTFVMANLLLFGPIIGGITAAMDGLGGSLRCRTKERKTEFMLFNITAMALSAYAVGELFFWLLGHGPLYQDRSLTAGQFFMPAVVLALVYYVLNATSVALIVALQAQVRLLKIWRENLLWGFAAATASAVGAVVVVAGVLSSTAVSTAAVLLLLSIIYMTYRASTQRVPTLLRLSL